MERRTHGALEEKPLLLLQLINPALNRVLNDKATNFDGPVLAETMDAVHGLRKRQNANQEPSRHKNKYRP
jgi:hypothetical protein